MPSRTITATTGGPVTIDATLLGHSGTITVRADAHCDQATLTISTTDDTGPAADTVRDAALTATIGRITVEAHGRQAVGNNNCQIIQSAGNVYGTMTGVTIVNGQVTNGGTFIAASGTPIEITATVPEGSSVIGRTQSADVIAEGALLNVTGTTQSGSVQAGHVARAEASTQSGAVVIERAAQTTARTMSGDIRLGKTDVVEATTMSGGIQIRDFGGTARLKTMSGRIRVRARAGGDLDANTMSGDITVTADPAAHDQGLDVRPQTMSGRIDVPARPSGPTGVRRRS